MVMIIEWSTCFDMSKWQINNWHSVHNKSSMMVICVPILHNKWKIYRRWECWMRNYILIKFLAPHWRPPLTDQSLLTLSTINLYTTRIHFYIALGLATKTKTSSSCVHLWWSIMTHIKCHDFLIMAMKTAHDRNLSWTWSQAGIINTTSKNNIRWWVTIKMH